ncbi:MAG: hypothetical protein OXQ29_02635 [Rhodospirillaceae bacterium]|nr:hypothetical protein [Rhodospirillaceae bacterium]
MNFDEAREYEEDARRVIEQIRPGLSPTAPDRQRNAALTKAATLTYEHWAPLLARYPGGGTGIQRLAAMDNRPELRVWDYDRGRIRLEDLIEGAKSDEKDLEALVLLAERRLRKRGPPDALNKWIVDGLKRLKPIKPRTSRTPDTTLPARNTAIGQAIDWVCRAFRVRPTHNTSLRTRPASGCEIVRRAFPTLGLGNKSLEKIWGSYKRAKDS